MVLFLFMHASSGVARGLQSTMFAGSLTVACMWSLTIPFRAIPGSGSKIQAYASVLFPLSEMVPKERLACHCEKKLCFSPTYSSSSTQVRVFTCLGQPRYKETKYLPVRAWKPLGTFCLYFLMKVENPPHQTSEKYEGEELTEEKYSPFYIWLQNFFYWAVYKYWNSTTTA